MPATTESPSLSASSTTFTSVLEEGAGTGNARLKTQTSSSSSRPPSRSHQIPLPNSQRGIYHPSPAPASRRGSLKSDSAESSPTTTISTVDSTLTEPSPSSSPESPTSLIPLTNFSPLKSMTLKSERQSMDFSLASSSTQPSLSAETTETTGKRPKNLRNLFINTNGISTRPSTTGSMVTATESFAPSPGAAKAAFSAAVPGLLASISGANSEPVSPSFIVPSIPPPRKSKLGLLISTSEPNSSNTNGVPCTPAFAPPPMGLRRRGEVPPTPAFGRGFGGLSSMRESNELLFSPAASPAGGMKLPPFGRAFDRSLPTPSRGPEGGMSFPLQGAMSLPEGSPDVSPPRAARAALSVGSRSFEGGPGSSVIHQTIEHNSQVPLHELPLSREIKSPSYPDGPIRIYSPNVYLYHQPTCEEAREFDVIINVAREVTNPFEAEAEAEAAQKAESKYQDMGVQCDLLPAPPLSLAFGPSHTSPPKAEAPQAYNEPDTPKAATPPLSAKKNPLYVHLPWEHNSAVYLEWVDICDRIDRWTKEGKRVLIHCQLGVSRSASLIVAYGLYRNPHLTPDEAREQAKERSRWIDLNMHFMYELGDFKKVLMERSGIESVTRRPAGQQTPALAKTERFVGSKSPDLVNGSMEARRASSGMPQTTFSESAEEERAFSPFGASSLPKLSEREVVSPEPPSALQLPIRETTGKSSSETVFDTSDVTTPVRAEDPSEPNFSLGGRKDSQKTLRAVESAELPPPIPTTQVERAEPPTPLKLSHPASKPASTPTPPRKLRAKASLPAGFSSIRRVTPSLSLNTNTTAPAFASFKPSTKGDAPQLPELSGFGPLMSPRTENFAALGHFHRNSLAGDLAGADTLMSPGALDRDPRSPPIKEDHTITRIIDDVL